MGFGWGDDRWVSCLGFWNKGPGEEKAAIGLAEGSTCPGVENIPENSVDGENPLEVFNFVAAEGEKEEGEAI